MDSSFFQRGKNSLGRPIQNWIRWQPDKLTF
nr:MAG TPA: hypothetical protein [Caudoviricetes sp.]